MKTRESNRRLFWLVLAVLALTPATGAFAQRTEDPVHHMGDRTVPWESLNCTMCHGGDLLGDIGPSCMDCHNDFFPPDPPASGHHMPGREDPLNNCATCHGDDLTGDFGPSCTTCHAQTWTDPGGGGNQPPIIDFGGPYAAAPGVEIQFDASGTIDPDGDSLIYLWSFGDGSIPEFPSGNPLSVPHAYKNAGSYTAILTVTDGHNTPIIINIPVEIGGDANQPPSADAGGPYTSTEAKSVSLSGSGSSDPEGDSLTYSWNFGDGGSGSGVNVSHTYAAAGTYTITLSVDDGGSTAATDTAQITVIANQPPTADAGGPYSSSEGNSVSLSGSGSSDPEGDSLTYVWDFGDGGSGSGVNVSHTYADAGTYTVTLTVDDGINTPVASTAQITVEESTGGGDPPPGAIGGDTWEILVPFYMGELTISIEPFGPILLMHITHADGSASFGIGMEYAGNIFWMDVTGALYYGAMDSETGTAWGIVFGYEGGGSSIWFGERQPTATQ